MTQSHGNRLIAALIRHGEYEQLPDTPSAHQPYALNKKGNRHARAGAAELLEAVRKNNWNVYPVFDCSTLLRAWQTAGIYRELMAESMTVEPVLESFDMLVERGMGSAANLSMGEINRIIEADPRYDPPPRGWKSMTHYRLPMFGAESLHDAGIRVAGHIDHRLDAVAGVVDVDTVKIFVGHGAAFRHAVRSFGVISDEDAVELRMRYGRPMFFERLADGQWRHIGGRWKRIAPE
ncbi:MAG: phosphoglycerate mutase family protein [Pseudomonadota bacterium]